MTEDEIVGGHHWLNGRGFGWTPGVGDGQGGLACCSSWGRKESDTTERLNWTDLIGHLNIFYLKIYSFIDLNISCIVKLLSTHIASLFDNHWYWCSHWFLGPFSLSHSQQLEGLLGQGLSDCTSYRVVWQVFPKQQHQFTSHLENVSVPWMQIISPPW